MKHHELNALGVGRFAVEETGPAYKEMIARYPDAMPLRECGQKAVFYANDSANGMVAVKIGKCSSSAEFERIRREVELLKGLKSDYYPKNHLLWGLDSEFLVVEEFVHGTVLADCMDRFYEPNEAAQLVLRLCSGLQLLWCRPQPVVHRDIKPDNVIIRDTGRPVIIDLGIARCLGETSLTNSMAWFGPCTPNYAAPEQLLNKKDAISWRTDQFALGLMLAQLLLQGQHPFDPQVVGAGGSIPENIVQDTWCETRLSVTELGVLPGVCRTMLGHQPYMRYRTPDTLMTALDAYLKGAK